MSGSLPSWLKQTIWNIWAPLTLFLMVLFFFPLRGLFRFSMDEGLGLMMGLLIERGYPLYSQIWSDQPPLFFHLLALLNPYLGFDVGSYRFVVLVLSGLLLWGAFTFLRSLWGNWVGVLGVILILTLPKYMVLSISVMAGLPAITFAMLSLLALTTWHRGGRWIWVVLSAILLSISVLIKLFTGFLAPIFLVGILIEQYVRQKDKPSWLAVIAPAFWWGVVFTVLTIGLGLLLVGSSHLPQLILDHLAARGVEAFNHASLSINFHLRQVWPLMLLSLIGTVLAVRARRWLSLYLFAWMAVAYLLLSGHAPVWDHQQILITIPAAMLGGIAIYEGFLGIQRVIQSRLSERAGKGNTLKTLLAASIVVVFLVFIAWLVPGSLRLLSPTPSISHSGLGLDESQEQVLNIMGDYAPQTNWVVSDQLMYPFRTRLPVPPNLAMFTSKRFQTGQLTEGEIIATIQEWKPEQVLLSRFEYDEVDQYLSDGYDLAYKFGKLKLYVRNDLRR